jgi:hypothetical protein
MGHRLHRLELGWGRRPGPPGSSMRGPSCQFFVFRSGTGSLTVPHQARFWVEWGLFSGVVWPHAMGIEKISGSRALPLCHLLLLSPATVAHRRPRQANLRTRAGACAAQFQTLRLRICGHAGACSLTGQRTGARSARRRSHVAEARRVAALGRECPVGWPSIREKALSRQKYPVQCRGTDFNVRNYRQFVEKLCYIHRNPVKRGLCERPEDWEWSSFRQYATGCEGRVEIECEWTARRRERAAGTLCPAVELRHSSQKTA